MSNPDVETIKIEMAQPIDVYLRIGILCAYLIVLYFAPVTPWAIYAITALGMVSWYLFCNAYNLAAGLYNEQKLNALIASLDEGTLSDIDGLIDERTEEDE